MIRAQSFFSCRRTSPWWLGLTLAALPAACAPQRMADPVSPEPITTASDSNGPSLVGRLDAGSIMSKASDPAQSFHEGLAASSASSGPRPSEDPIVDVVASPPVESTVEGPVLDIDVPIAPVESSPIPLSLARVDEALARLAAEADDPVVYEFVRSMLPILALEGVGEEEPGFQPSAQDLLADEVDMLEAVSEFALGVRAGMVSGGSPKEILIERLSELLKRLRNESGLEMGQVELCTSIAGYGDLEIASRKMSAGQDQDILVYAELNGLEWEAQRDGKVGWQLRYRLQLHQMSDGMVIDPGVESGISDTLVAPVDENYLWIKYRLPAGDLNASRYVLKLWVREPSTNREDERSIEIDLLPRRLLGRAAAAGGS